MSFDFGRTLGYLGKKIAETMKKPEATQEQNHRVQAIAALKRELTTLEARPDAAMLGRAVRMHLAAYCGLRENSTLEEIVAKIRLMHLPPAVKERAIATIDIVNELDYARTKPDSRELRHAAAQCSRLADELKASTRQAEGNKTIAAANNTVLRSSSPVKDNGLSARSRTKAARPKRGRKP